MKPEPLNCPCGGAVVVLPSYGGAGGNQTFYYARCQRCGRTEDDMGTDGTRRSAIRQWNRLVRREPTPEGEKGERG